MRILIGISLILLTAGVSAQVEINRAITFGSGTNQVQGLASPTAEQNLSSLGSIKSGFVHWCAVNRSADTLELSPGYPVDSRVDGQLLRFAMDMNSPGDTWVKVGSFPSSQVLDGDGNPIGESILRQGEIVQIQWIDSAYVLANPPSRSCPSGYIKVSESLCIQSSDNTDVDWFEANEKCDEQGARLCTWAEYIHACLNHGGQMTGLFNNWEWLDDTSDHTHTADQVGRFTCHSNRSRGATHQDFANFRCCYLLR